MRSNAGLACAVASFASACAVLPSHSSDPAPIVRGPLAWRVQHPLALTSLSLLPRSLPTQAPGTYELGVSASYSSMFENASSATDQVVLDGEILRVAARARVPIAAGTDFEIEVPFVYASSGFLDGFVQEFHDLFNLPSGGSDERPKYDYDMFIEKDGVEAYHLEPNRVELGDVPLVLTQMIVDEDEDLPAIACRFGVELPTGDEDCGTGNGELDFGAGLCAQRSFGRWTWIGGMSYVATGESSMQEASGTSYNDAIDAHLGTEYRWNDRLSLLGGLIYEPPVMDGVDLEEIDSSILELELGFAWDTAPDSTLSVGFGEDLIAGSGPDFSVWLAWTLRL